MIIYTVDAFTDTAFKGNPAGVCLVNEFPSEAFMQCIAMELSYANSAFVKKIGDNHFHIKWFTPLSFAPLCGHATLATLHILKQEELIDLNQEVKFESMSGKLVGFVNESDYSLNFPLYQIKSVTLTHELSAVVDQNPIYTGFSENCYLMEFQNADTLLKLKVNLELLKKINCRALIATAIGDGDKYDFHSRYFAPRVGIDEDPVCASAHCRLIPYWSDKLGKKEMTSYQLSRRGGLLKCENLGDRVLISGNAITTMKSHLLV